MLVPAWSFRRRRNLGVAYARSRMADGIWLYWIGFLRFPAAGFRRRGTSLFVRCDLPAAMQFLMGILSISTSSTQKEQAT
jgi:hypothetical protein